MADGEKVGSGKRGGWREIGGVAGGETGGDVFCERRIYLEEKRKKKKLSQSFKVGSIAKPKGNCFAPTRDTYWIPKEKLEVTLWWLI